jgi:hypothetical protein
MQNLDAGRECISGRLRSLLAALVRDDIERNMLLHVIVDEMFQRILILKRKID